jgi:hypothetical protein
MLSYHPDYDVRGKAVNAILKNISDMPDMDNLLVLPEGIMVNFLTKKVCPIEFNNFMLPEILIFGEDNMLSSMKNKPPQYILFLDRDTSEYGVESFRKDEMYGKKIMAWINENYTLFWQISIDNFRHISLGSPKLVPQITAKMVK